MELKEIRAEIDNLDGKIKDLLLKRYEYSLEVAKNKAINKDGNIYKKEREEEIIDRLTLESKDKNLIKNVFNSIFIESRTSQYRFFADNNLINLDIFNKVYRDKVQIEEIVLQGIEGSYAEIAAECISSVKKSFEKDFVGVFKKVKGNTFGLVPVDNSTAGTVGEVYDLLQKFNLYIVGSKSIKIEHSLLGIKGAALSDLKTVYSHPQALMQCSKFLSDNNIEGIAVANTAIAAELVSKNKDFTRGAICSFNNAQRYNLNVIKNNINNYPENYTRFILLSDKFLCSDKDNSTISIVFNIADEAGSLNKVMSIFASYNISLSKIESRPNCLGGDGNRANEWKYIFYADFAAKLSDNNTKALLYQLYKELPYVKLLGCYCQLEDKRI